MRNYGLALIAAGSANEGFRNVATGYRIEPSMLDRPLSVSDLGGAQAYTALLDAAARAADTQNTAESYLSLAVLHDANGQRDAAETALKSARDRGLEAALLDKFVLRFAQAR